MDVGEGKGSTRPGALEGIRVLELGHGIAGPHCAQILADHGADVVKVEPPRGQGRDDRLSLPVDDGESFYFASHNRGKRSVVIDLKSPGGLAVFRALALRADVVVTNYGADVPRRLGIDYEALKVANPGLVYVHVTGFGFASPYRDFRAFDGVIQAMSGLPSMTGTPEGEPAFVGTFIADHMAANQAALGVLFGLAQRQRTGVGGFVDIGMLDGYTSVLAHMVGEVLDMGRTPTRTANRCPTAFATTYPATDGQVYLAPLSETAWREMCDVMGAPNWLRNADALWALNEGRDQSEQWIAEWCKSRGRVEIISALRAVGVPCGPVQDVNEALRDPAMEQTGAITKVDVRDGREFSVPGPPVRYGLSESSRSRQIPRRGEHTRQLLEDLEFSPRDIDELFSLGSVE